MTALQAKRFNRRIGNIYRGQVARAKKKLVVLGFDKNALREHIEPQLQSPCPYCEKKLTIGTFQVDHSLPLSRGGGWALLNLVTCCAGCNRLKGSMTPDELAVFKALVIKYLPTAKKYIFASLKAGGARFS